MAHTYNPDAEPIALIGYSDKLSARPGDTIAFKVSSCHRQPYRARVVRIVCADPNPAVGLTEEAVDCDLNGTYPSRRQAFYPGSFATAAVKNLFADSFTLLATVWPTLPDAGEQGVLSCRNTDTGDGVDLVLDADGCGVSFAGRVVAHTGAKLNARAWYRLWASYDARSGALCVGQVALHRKQNATCVEVKLKPPSLAGVDRVTIAAVGDEPVRAHFNGKIEAPMIFNRALSEKEIQNGAHNHDGIVARWDFSRGIPTTRIHDAGPNEFHGELINLPARAMTGADWDGSEMCWRHAPAHYAAIHFHDDDIVDFNWKTDFSFTIPKDFRSGVYAVRVECGDDRDAMPFFVCAPKTKPSAKLCVLISTFTYAVYGNHARPDFAPSWLERIKNWRAYPHNPAMHRGYGLSAYNYHRDGSGIQHASHRRPLFNLRPGYITFGDGDGSGLRHLQADTHLIAWLEQNDIDYDIVTDQELHDDGVDAIKNYRALATGSHPEYHTVETLDALHAYRERGGNFLYLGGNGFYWKVALHEEDNGAIEIRRAEGGIRAWASAPGEYYQAFDGGYGGLWRRNDRPPQRLAGVGFSAQGTFAGSYYRRLPETFTDEKVNWMFDGIDDQVIGDFGFSGGGAAGFELDRADAALGSPDDLFLLARSEGHDATFVLVPEEQLTHLVTLPGEPVEKLIRADMVYQVNDNGGRLFAAGSITFCGSLLFNGGDNNISRLLKNVIARFVQ